ncbi:uncharacterized protein FYW47_000454 [Aplochiton taeniatus]
MAAPGHPQSLTLDRSQSAPASVRRAATPGPSHSQPGFQGLPGPSSRAQDATPPQNQPAPPPALPDPTAPPPSAPTSEALAMRSPCRDEAEAGTPALGCLEAAAPASSEGHGVERVVSSPHLSRPETATSPCQPMEQEADTGAPRLQSLEGEGRTHHPLASTPSPSLDSPAGPESAEMESPTSPSDRDQPEGEHCPGSDGSAPSLAAALLELHELLVSNSHSAASSPHPHRQDADGLDEGPATPPPENPPPAPSTATAARAEPGDSKANPSAVPDAVPPQCVEPGPSGQEAHPGREKLEAGEGPDGSLDRRPEPCELEEAREAGAPAPEGPSPPQEDLELREPPEGQQGRGVADGRASSSDTPDTVGLRPEPHLQSPLSMAVGSPEEDSPLSLPRAAQAAQPASVGPLPSSAPHPFTEQSPAESLRRIQAAGFSSREAAEALEQAQGSVELALLALLARHITVPT